MRSHPPHPLHVTHASNVALVSTLTIPLGRSTYWSLAPPARSRLPSPRSCALTTVPWAEPTESMTAVPAPVNEKRCRSEALRLAHSEGLWQPPSGDTTSIDPASRGP